ncbi:MAG: tryptophan synthase subunit alpha [Verrucomicrobia bacterium]|nr:MAG: tryptophan synthase subunit alpha [Verrucomicrobiota bacterium]
MSRMRDTLIEPKGSGRGGFIPFITAGDPDLATTELLLVELAAAGADIIELGVPFSDPVADGEVIQRASERALRKGVTLGDTLKCISNVKKHIDLPIVLFSYLNPLLKFGRERLADEAERVGIDAVLITDLTVEEAGPWVRAFHDRAIDMIFLVAPTTSDERLTHITQQASGFIYAVSRAGVTGAQNEMPADAESLVRRVRAVSDLPVAVGFGISTPEQVRQVWRFADGAVIGSALVSQIEKLSSSPHLVARVGEFARSLVARNGTL